MNSYALSQSSSCAQDMLPRRSLQNGKMGFMDLFENWIVNPKYFEVSPYEGSFAKVRFGSHYGFINCKGDEVIKPVYDELGFINKGRTWVRKEADWQLLDTTGNKMNADAFSDYKRTSVWNQVSWAKKSGKWHMLSESDGKYICDKSFTRIRVISDTLSMVSDDSYYGIINHCKCKWKVEESIVKAEKVSSQFIKVTYKNREQDILDMAGNSILPYPVDDIKNAGNGLARIQKDGLWGVITPNGKVVLDVTYENLEAFHQNRMLAKKSGKYLFLNASLKNAFNKSYENAESFFKGVARVKENGKWGLIDLKGSVIIKAEFDSVFVFGNQYLIKQENSWRIHDYKDLELNQIDFSDPLAESRVEKDGKWGLYNFETRQWKIPAKYDQINNSFSSHYQVILNDKIGILNSEGKIKIPVQYDNLQEIYGPREGMLIGKKGNDYALLNLKGNELIKSSEEIIYSNPYFKIEGEKELFLYKQNASLLFSTKGERIEVINSKHIGILNKGKWNVVDENNQELFKDAHFDFMTFENGHYAMKNKDGLWNIYLGNTKVLNAMPINEIKEFIGQGYIISSEGKNQWLGFNGKILQSGFKEYIIMENKYIALKFKDTYMLRTIKDKFLTEDYFEAVKVEDGVCLFMKNKKWYKFNKQNELIPFLTYTN